MHLDISLWLYCVRGEASGGGIAKEVQEFWNLMKKILSMDVSRVLPLNEKKNANAIQVFYIT